MAKMLRLQCPCGRNLADVRYSAANLDFTWDSLIVAPRPNVRQVDWKPREQAEQYRQAPTWWRDRTYTWRCKCGKTHTRRHQRISGAWAEWSADTDRVRVLVLGDAL